MDKSDNNPLQYSQLQIAFPESNEDHRLQLIAINGAIFAIIFGSLESNGPIRLNCEEWSLILLTPVKSKKNILISATNILCLSEIASEEGMINVHASNYLVKFANLIQPSEKVCEMGEKGELQFPEDSAALLYYYQLFEKILTNIRMKTPESFSDASQQLIAGLCAIAQKTTEKDLTLQNVLDFWKIPLPQDPIVP